MPFYFCSFSFLRGGFSLHCVFRASDNVNTTGQVKLTIGYSVEEGRLFITVHACRFASDFRPIITITYVLLERRSAAALCVSVCVCVYVFLHPHRALAACSKDGADPYVSFILLPDKKATTKRRTATKKRDLNPEFNERQDKEMTVTTEETRGR